MTQVLNALPASLLVAIGGAVGALARYQLGLGVARIAGLQAGFPWGTLAVNLLGCLAMGALMGALARTGAAAEPLRLLVGVGLLGGFTTFSAFGLEMVMLIERGSAGAAVLYAAGSFIGGIAALTCGLAIARGGL
ncbi:MAG: fluoride efflux transporter CrcB [Erythrobacter sp.]|jgi:CrcB protein|nr:fluoride efflux transporter CrcB [Erythrobacter sp.]